MTDALTRPTPVAVHVETKSRFKQPLDLIGQKFGELLVVKRVSNSRTGASRWLCECS